MKKLMIAAALVCSAVIAQASAFNWASKSSGTTGVLYNGTADAKAYDSFGGVTLYLFDAAVYSQANAFAGLTGAGLDTSKAVDSTTLSTASKIAMTPDFNYGTTGESYSFYFAAILKSDPKTFYISSLQANQMALESGTTAMTWGDLKATSQALLDTKNGFAGAGVYAAAAPEPTSAMLLLLGMAGLALKRKRA